MPNDQAILLVEDNPDEETLTLRAIQRHIVKASVAVARDGVEALEYLFPTNARVEAVMPRFVILDLKLPRLDGFEVIAGLRADPRTRLLPVVVFSSSGEGRDVRRCIHLGANGYVVKPVAAERYQETVRDIVHYWLNMNVDPYLRT